MSIFWTTWMQIRKKQLTKWNIFFTNIVKNIIWHLFADEPHQVEKIFVTYWTFVHSLLKDNFLLINDFEPNYFQIS
jgi:hypothetical protein